jgi:TolB protein
MPTCEADGVVTQSMPVISVAKAGDMAKFPVQEDVLSVTTSFNSAILAAALIISTVSGCATPPGNSEPAALASSPSSFPTSSHYPPTSTSTPRPTATATMPAPAPTLGDLTPHGRIVFEGVDNSTNHDLWVISPDGGAAQRLTTEGAKDKDPALSPDGLRIAFVSDRTGEEEIYLMNVDGSGVRRLTEDLDSRRAARWSPVWSPDGTRIAFASWDDSGTKVDIFTVDADGSDLTQLTDTDDGEGGLTWSPDGDQIGYDVSWGSVSRIFVMNADGSESVLLTDDSAYSFFPAWSPEEDKIAFIMYTGGDTSVFVMGRDGSDPIKLAGHSWDPAWSPDGRQLAVVSTFNGHHEIFILDNNGDGPLWVSSLKELGLDPSDLSWGP